MSAETDIRAVLDARTEALRTKDADAMTTLYEPGARMFELAPPLSYVVDPDRTPDGYRAWFATWNGPIHYEVKDFAIEVHGGFAFATGFIHLYGVKSDGEKIDGWYRQTAALHNTKAGWRIAHQHTSVPFYMDGSYRAATDLTP
jgi:PhnB protein